RFDRCAPGPDRGRRAHGVHDLCLSGRLKLRKSPDWRLDFGPIAPIITPMLFVGVALLIAAGIGLLVSVDAATQLSLTQAQFGQILVAVILVIVFASAVFSRRQRFSSIAANLGVWLGLFAVALVGYTYREDIKTVAARVFGELSPTTAIVDSK